MIDENKIYSFTTDLSSFDAQLKDINFIFIMNEDGLSRAELLCNKENRGKFISANGFESSELFEYLSENKDKVLFINEAMLDEN